MSIPLEKGNKFKGIAVTAKSDELPEKMIKRFMKTVRASGVLQEVHQRKGYDKPSVQTRRKRARNAFLRKHSII